MTTMTNKRAICLEHINDAIAEYEHNVSGMGVNKAADIAITKIKQELKKINELDSILWAVFVAFMIYSFGFISAISLIDYINKK